MATIKKCKTCGGAVSSSARVCPHCGQKDPGSLSTGKIVLIWAIVTLSLSFLLYGCSALYRPSNSNSGGSRYNTPYKTDSEYRRNVDDVAEIYGVSPEEIDRTIHNVLNGK